MSKATLMRLQRRRPRHHALLRLMPEYLIGLLVVLNGVDEFLDVVLVPLSLGLLVPVKDCFPLFLGGLFGNCLSSHDK